MKTNLIKHKKKFVPNSFKFLVAVGSLAGTVGIWSAIANKDLSMAYAQNIVSTDPVSETDIPTAMASAPTATASTNEDVTTLREVNVPTNNNAPSVTVSSSVSASSLPSSIPAPVARTRSSRP
mgnify:CR=1 FL=1